MHIYAETTNLSEVKEKKNAKNLHCSIETDTIT